MVSESDRCILSKDVSSIASMADVLFPEIPKIYMYVSVSAMLILLFKYQYRHRFQIMCIGASLIYLSVLFASVTLHVSVPPSLDSQVRI